MKIYLLILAYLAYLGIACLPTSSLQAQAPGWSRGQQLLAITYDDGIRRAATALQAEGYRLDYSAGAFSVGVKGVHTAVIMCNPAPDSRLTVNIVVASNGQGGGEERQRLQMRMDNPGTGYTTPAPARPAPAGSRAVDWNYQVSSDLRGKNNQRFSFFCPSGSPTNRVWGTDIYTDDSSVCTAAVHAGLITPSGGTVTVEIRPGLSAYAGSSRNGITSNNYAGWYGSFVFVR